MTSSGNNGAMSSTWQMHFGSAGFQSICLYGKSARNGIKPETMYVNTGDVVLIIDENAPRGCWPMGLVVGVTQGRDGLVRSVKIKCRDKFVVRPITKIVLLESKME